MKFLILNGPNVNLQRYSEPGMPGELDYNGMMDYVQSGCDQMGIETDVCQTNHEGDLIDEIQAAAGRVDGIVLNPGGYAHTSVAILDALRLCSVPAVEVMLDAPDELYFDYTRFYALGPRHVPGARKVLMLGGGGYSVPKWLLSGKSGLDAPRLRLTVVELDPAMTASSRRWFGLRDDPRLTVRHEDARAFLNRQNERYDLVFVDVFNSHYSVPFQMGTVEAARALRRAVAPGGALLMNVISAVEGPDGRLFRGICHALAAAFAEVRVYCVGRPDRPGEVQNLMLLAFPEAVPDAAPPAADAAAGATDPPAPETDAMLAVRYAGVIPADIPALTDDFAPVERYALMLLRQ